MYVKHVNDMHTNFSVSESGLHIYPGHPHLGATPDGLIECTCCEGKGVLEVKCPFCKKDQTVEEASQDKRFCLHEVNGQLLLKEDHQYYYQVQTQIFITQRKYCDFVVWTEESLYIQRIFADDSFLNNMLRQMTMFYVKCILPELMSHYFSKKLARKNESNDLYCYCRKQQEDMMISCQSDSCIFKKFHLHCIGLKRKPKPDWQCIECKKSSRRQLSSNV